MPNQAMSTLAAQFQPVGNDLPVVAFVKILLAPLVCVACLAACLAFYQEPFTPRYAGLAVIAFLISMRIFGEMPLTNGRSILMPGGAIFSDWIAVIVALLFIAFVLKVSALYSRKVVLTWFVMMPFALHGAQALARLLLQRFTSSGALARTKVIVGINKKGYELAREINEDPFRGVLRGYFDDRSTPRIGRVKSYELLGGLEHVVDYVKRNSIDVVYITLPMSRDLRIMRLLDRLQDTTASVYFVPSTLPFDMIQARVERIGKVPVIALCETPFYGVNGIAKRTADIVITSMILLLIWPLMLAIAIGVRRSSPGPVVFKQRRYGLDGKEIMVYKFRTMTVCEDGKSVTQASKGDRRITRFGAFLRKTSLDELPQFFNVLQGTMSIVGPRPHAVAHNEQYRRLIDGYMIRHKVKPGITGWAQVNGYRGETEVVSKMEKRIEYDLDYLRHWSLSLDLWIILKTVLVVFKDHRNAY
jgi:putative colanic acid biosynthesis UDP-glucose lipid carrier transferase